jgi:hypothetical protein
VSRRCSVSARIISRRDQGIVAMRAGRWWRIRSAGVPARGAGDGESPHGRPPRRASGQPGAVGAGASDESARFGGALRGASPMGIVGE